MVTQPSREVCCTASVANFAAQTFEEKELVIVHDGPLAKSPWLKRLVAKYGALDIQLSESPPDLILGSLRNLSIERATHPIICNWDDDDLSHPDRLAIQFQHMVDESADFSCFTDQLHLFSQQRVLFWDDWAIETWPDDLIPCTLMGKKELVGRYLELSIGEDSELIQRLAQEGKRFAKLSDAGWLYLYIYHGSNTWHESHHKAISKRKRRDEKALSSGLALLRRELPKFRLPWESIDMLHNAGKFTIRLGDNS